MTIRRNIADIMLAAVVAFLFAAMVYTVSQSRTLSFTIPSAAQLEWSADTSWTGGWR